MQRTAPTAGRSATTCGSVQEQFQIRMVSRLLQREQMGQRRYPPLTPGEVIDILTALGFRKRGQEGSHAQYYRPACGRFAASVVTVDVKYAEFDDERIKNMIRQSQHSRDEFYGATKRTARKAGVGAYVMSGD
jgi:predicted RNA binding protein YcfA (HicA-like mRNA interferase family)